MKKKQSQRTIAATAASLVPTRLMEAEQLGVFPSCYGLFYGALASTLRSVAFLVFDAATVFSLASSPAAAPNAII
jgi:hypothetical protein